MVLKPFVKSLWLEGENFDVFPYHPLRTNHHVTIPAQTLNIRNCLTPGYNKYTLLRQNTTHSYTGYKEYTAIYLT